MAEVGRVRRGGREVAVVGVGVCGWVWVCGGWGWGGGAGRSGFITCWVFWREFSDVALLLTLPGLPLARV